jgi:hypothetical protein
LVIEDPTSGTQPPGRLAHPPKPRHAHKEQENMPKKFATQIIITGPAKSLAQFKRRAKGIAARYSGEPTKPRVDLSFHALVPVPSVQLARPYTVRTRITVADSGLDWELAHWGCPLGAIESISHLDDRTLTYWTLTLVATPIKFFRTVSAMFPRLSFNILSINLRTRSKTMAEFKNGKKKLKKK